MIHEVVYHTYPIDRLSGNVSEVPSNTFLVAYTDAEVDEIPERIAQHRELHTQQLVKVKVLSKKIVHGDLILVEKLPPLQDDFGYETEFPDESHASAISRERPGTTSSGLVDPSSF